jgi:hypothetical protein
MRMGKCDGDTQRSVKCEKLVKNGRGDDQTDVINRSTGQKETVEKMGLAPDMLCYPVRQTTAGRVPVPLFQRGGGD